MFLGIFLNVIMDKLVEGELKSIGNQEDEAFLEETLRHHRGTVAEISTKS